MSSRTPTGLPTPGSRSSRRRGPLVSTEYVEAIVEAEVDAAARELLVAAEAEAAAILETHRGALEALTERLVLHRAGSGRDIASWLSGQLALETAAESGR